MAASEGYIDGVRQLLTAGTYTHHFACLHVIDSSHNDRISVHNFCGIFKVELKFEKALPFSCSDNSRIVLFH